MVKKYMDKDWLTSQYCEKRRRVQDIAQKCNVSVRVIWHWVIQKFNLKRKRILPIRSKKDYKVDENYFEKIDNEEKAYWLGFIAADGYVTINKGKRILGIMLSSKDKDHLMKFKNNIGYEGPLYDVVCKGKRKDGTDIHKVMLQIGCWKIVLDLVGHGIVPRKILILKRPDIDEKLYNHWIRGCFDGDGSISLCKDGNLRGSFFGTEDVVDFMATNVPGTNTVSIRKDCHGYYHSFSGNRLSKKIYDYLYDVATVCLERKRNKFLLIS